MPPTEPTQSIEPTQPTQPTQPARHAPPSGLITDGSKRRRGMFWPLLLIAIGLIGLASNYGWVQPITVVSLLALWPVLLILLGIDIAFARRWPVATLAAEVLVIAAALSLAATQPSALRLVSFSFDRSGDCTAASPSGAVARSSMQSLRLSISGGAARYHVGGGATAAVTASADGADLCLVDRTTRDSTKGDVRLTQAGATFGGNTDVTVQIANDLPVSLQVNAGAGEFTFDLHDVRVTDARLNIGAASTTIVLPKPVGDVGIRMDGGASSVVIEIPADIDARITVTGGLVSSSSINPRATKSGNIIETAGYSAAKDRVTVTVTGGATSVSVR